MKTTIAVALFLASSALAPRAEADSACVRPQPCPPVIDGGSCAMAVEIGAACGEDAGTCDMIPPGCPQAGALACLGPTPDATPCMVEGSTGCGVASERRGVGAPSSAPWLLCGAFAVAAVLERRRRERAAR